ncbi:MAG TPA: DNA polymerase III subunit alpha [Myxococcales bacterium]|nr:DNA polymerase III subunit alpha [Myxococcales bacterium]
MSFAHLHVHTQYSFLDGANKISALAEATKNAGMNAVAMTDRGNMYGAVEFQKACLKNDVKPIFGCELFVVQKDRTDPSDSRHTSLVLLAETLEGYRNLIACVSHTWLEGWHNDMPRADRALLEEYRSGTIALSGGMGGDVAQALLRRDVAKAKELIEGWRDLFGVDNYFIQLEDYGLREHAQINEQLVELANECGVRTVATNACHYLKAEDARSHAALMCIGLAKDFSALKENIPDGLWLKPEPFMREQFDWALDSVDTAAEVAARCNVEIPLGATYLPQYEVPEDVGLDGFLRQKSLEGLEQRFVEFEVQGLNVEKQAYFDRLDTEIETIVAMGFPGYFLIVWDFIAKAREMGVPVGPGRGSGAGSLVAYTLGITDIDPLRYGLLFERFLNVERVSMPDFDIDFCMAQRDKVIRYVTEKYGKHNVGQIITYGTLKAKAALRDIGRVLNLSFGEVDRIAKLIPDELGINLTDSLKKEPRIRELFSEDPRYKELYDTALKVEGLTRHAGIHAAGIVISEEPLWHYVPICRGAGGEIVTQYAKDEVEQAGLVKFDFLGLKTLTVIDHSVRLINETLQKNGEELFDLRSVPMDDSKVFELLSSGETTGVFQLESSGFKELMKKLRPNCFEDIVAAVALYRPGPLGSGMVDDFVKRKHGETKVEYPHPILEEVLKETYGVIVYQEQVMQIARTVGGYSLGGADILRRAMGKKKAEVMAEQKTIFLDGAKQLGIVEPGTAEKIFDLMAYFAGYGFNKSHSAAYGLISYQTAYLKAHHPVEFMAALLTADGDNTDKVVRYIGDAKTMGIVVRPPDVNLSQKGFSVDNGGIRFGMGAIKNVGEGAVDSIIAEREVPYNTLFEFVERVDLKRVNRRVVEALTKSGAFDCFGKDRGIIFHNIERALERGQSMARDRESGQTSLFGLLDVAKGGDGDSNGKSSYDMDVDEWTDRARLSFEKDAIGFYVSGHPLDRFKSEIKRYASDTSKLATLDNRQEITLAAVVVAMRERPLKSGNGRMAFLTIEDTRGQAEILVFSKVFALAEELIKSGEPLLIKGSVQIEGDDDVRNFKLRATEISLLSAVRRERTSTVAFTIGTDTVVPEAVARIRQICNEHPGVCKVMVFVTLPGSGTAMVTCSEELRVDASEELINAVQRILGRDSITLS